MVEPVKRGRFIVDIFVDNIHWIFFSDIMVQINLRLTKFGRGKLRRWTSHHKEVEVESQKLAQYNIRSAP